MNFLIDMGFDNNEGNVFWDIPQSPYTSATSPDEDIIESNTIPSTLTAIDPTAVFKNSTKENISSTSSFYDPLTIFGNCSNFSISNINENYSVNITYQNASYADLFSDVNAMCNNSSSDNGEKPPFLQEINIVALISYSILFPIAAVGNLLVFIALIKNRHRKSRVNMMILHLSIADMIVAFFFLPIEIIWNVSIEWVIGGNIGCKLYKMLSAFGFYLSSMVLVCISLDRYYAVLHPLKVNDAQRRGKMMLLVAWMTSLVVSLPQVSFLFL